MKLLLDHHLPSVQENSKIRPNICKTNICTWGEKRFRQLSQNCMHSSVPMLTYRSNHMESYFRDGTGFCVFFFLISRAYCIYTNPKLMLFLTQWRIIPSVTPEKGLMECLVKYLKFISSSSLSAKYPMQSHGAQPTVSLCWRMEW